MCVVSKPQSTAVNTMPVCNPLFSWDLPALPSMAQLQRLSLINPPTATLHPAPDSSLQHLASPAGL